MKFYDIISTLIIILIFLSIYFFNFISIGKKNIEKDWPKYRCNPMIMPFAGYFGHDAVQNFNVLYSKYANKLYGLFINPNKLFIGIGT